MNFCINKKCQECKSFNDCNNKGLTNPYCNSSNECVDCLNINCPISCENNLCPSFQNHCLSLNCY